MGHCAVGVGGRCPFPREQPWVPEFVPFSVRSPQCAHAMPAASSGSPCALTVGWALRAEGRDEAGSTGGKTEVPGSEDH